MKNYKAKEVFKTLQGEGFHAGRSAVFCRFTGCNGWSGREEDRDKGPFACSAWCDTNFIGTDGLGGGRYLAHELVGKCAEVWGPQYRRERFVVLTGGEPMLQVDDLLLDTFRRFEFTVAIETNGTIAVPRAIDWITVSPKAGSTLVQMTGNELKLVYPQLGAEPERFEDLEFEHFYLQPMDGPDREANTQAAAEYCLGNPRWRLSMQTHKLIGLP